MTKKNLRMAVSTVLMMGSAAASAQTLTVIRPAYQDPGSVSAAQGTAASTQLGDSPVFFTPYAGLAVGHDDNLFLSNGGEKGSNLVVASPGFKLDARTAASVMQVSYQAQLGRYTSSSDDNYFDSYGRAQYDMAFSGRAFLRLGFDYIHGHDPRGSTDRAFASSPDKYRLYSPNATFSYGAPGAQGRLEVYYTDAHKSYINNRQNTQFSDRDVTEYGTAFYWRVMPKTYLLGEVRQSDISYELSSVPASGRERRYYVGASWEATAATTGTLKVGRLERDFDFGRPRYTGSSWEGLITWAPRTYSTFDFYTARQTNESTGLGNFILTDIYGATWNHAWSSAVNTAVILRGQRDDYQGFDRSDKTATLGLKVGYKFRRWLTLGAEYNHIHRDSNINIYDYDRNLYFLTATASM